MKKLILILFLISGLSSNAQSVEKLVTKKTHFKFFSHTVAEDIEAHNYKTVGTLNTETGEIVFSVPMQSYEFEKAKMQQHYNSAKFLDTKQFPKSKLKGKITDLSNIDFEKNGKYEVTVEGDLTIHGVTKKISEPATINVSDGTIAMTSVFNLTLADYGIAFEDGKPSTNIAKDIQITAIAEY